MESKESPRVGIIMGSASDRQVMAKAEAFLNELGIANEFLTASAHRTPERVKDYAQTARDRGIQVIIAGAGWAAHLAGVIAAWTDLPVVAVPIGSSVFNGLDSLLSSVMMPSGIPVAVMAVDGAKNAAIFAAQILSLHDPVILERLVEFRRRQSQEVVVQVPS